MDAELALDRARMWIGVGRPEKAVDLALQALAADPQDADASCVLAWALLAEGRAEQALAAADKAVGLAPGDEWPHRLRGYALLELGRPALTTARETVRLAPDVPSSHLLLASAALAAGKAAEARAAADRAQALDPDSPEPYALRGDLAYREGDYPQAVSHFNQSLALDPERSALHAGRAWALLANEQDVWAERSFREALRMDPQDERALRGLVGMARRKLWSRAITPAATVAFWVAWIVVLGGRASLAETAAWVAAVLAIGIPIGLLFAEDTLSSDEQQLLRNHGFVPRRRRRDLRP